jgi:hypothetical protein
MSLELQQLPAMTSRVSTYAGNEELSFGNVNYFPKNYIAFSIMTNILFCSR